MSPVVADTLPDPEFTVTTIDMPAGTEFSFTLGAAGEFVVDWGDGNVETITKPDATNTAYSHTYESGGVYTIGMSGQATGYWMQAAISFSGNTNIAGINGSLGAIFGTTDPTKAYNSPKFKGTFNNCTNLTGTIPENLFDGINEAPVNEMFYYTFYGCSNLSGSIPGNLFSGIKGAPATGMFQYTFSGCSNLTGSIPENLFSGIEGKPANYMFRETFSGCSNLSGSIPENLFAGISGAPALSMFWSTFDGCSNLSGSIPENLFKGISGAPAQNMFYGTFGGCSNLSGSIPGNLFSGIKGAPAVQMFTYTFGGCSNLSGSIPGNLFSGIKGAPANWMFGGIFNGCSNLSGSIPGNLFSGIKGAPASAMFQFAFQYCSGLTGYIPYELFAGISDPNQMSYCAFCGSGLSKTCPENTVSTSVFYDGKAVCRCATGTYSDNGVCTICPNNMTSRLDATSVDDCGHILHIGDETLFLRQRKETTPSLNVRIENDIFYASMAPGDIPLRPDSQRKLKTIWNDVVYSIYEKR